MAKKFQFAFLIVVPIIFLVIGLRFDRTKFGTDPESAYLLNGLNIATGKAVGHFDNPGTTVQMYSAVVLRVTHLFRFSGKDIETDVLSNSEFYIEVLRKGHIFINALILLLLGFVASSILGNIWIGFLLQTAPFLSVTLIEECFTKVAPEQFLFTAIAVLIMLLLKFYTSENPNHKKFPLLFGLLAGFGLATKMTFLPILIIPFVVLKGQKNKWLYVATIFPAFILFTLPAAKGYLHMAYWLVNLGTHTGTYGQGDSGFIDFAMYFSALVSITEINKSLIAVMLLSALSLLLFWFIGGKQKRQASKSEVSILLAVLISQFGSILMVAKHYQSNHYLFPALSLTGFALVFIYLLINKSLAEKLKKAFRFTLPLMVAVVIGFSLLNVPYLTLAYQGYRASNQSTDKTMAGLERDYAGYVKVYYYPISFNECSSLRWGNVYSRLYSSDKLLELFPEGLFFNVQEKSFQLWETNIPATELVKKYGDKILLVGGPRTDYELKAVEDCGLKLKRLFDSRVQAVFEIDKENSELFTGTVHSSPPFWSLQNDFETISPDGQWILSGNGDRFCKNENLSTDKSRSGNHAFILSYTDSYAMAYELKDVKPGDSYEISIWKTANSKDAFLVASSVTSEPFYQQSSGYVETDDKGWEKAKLDIKIPDGFKGNKLKVYLWNHGSGAVWCDDFEIKKY